MRHILLAPAHCDGGGAMPAPPITSHVLDNLHYDIAGEKDLGYLFVRRCRSRLRSPGRPNKSAVEGTAKIAPLVNHF